MEQTAGHELIIQDCTRIVIPLEVDVMPCVNRMFVSRGGIYTQSSPRTETNTDWLHIKTRPELSRRVPLSAEENQAAVGE